MGEIMKDTVPASAVILAVQEALDYLTSEADVTPSQRIRNAEFVLRDLIDDVRGQPEIHPNEANDFFATGQHMLGVTE